MPLSESEELELLQLQKQKASAAPQGFMGKVRGVFDAASKIADRPEYATSPVGLLKTADSSIRSGFDKFGEKSAELLTGQTSLDPTNPLTGKSLMKKPLTLTNPNPVNPTFAAVVGTLMQMAPDIVSAAAAPIEKPQGFEKEAQDQGMKAFGVTKRFLNKAPKADRMREATQTLMDEGVLTPFSTAENLIDKTNEVHDVAGRKIGSYLKSLEGQGKYFDKASAVAELESLRPVGDQGEILRGGDYADINKEIDKAIDTLTSHKSDKLTFETANQIKKTLQSKVDFMKKAADPVELTKRIIAGKFRDIIDKSIDGVSGSGKELSDPAAATAFQDFLKQKKLYGAASTMVDPLYNRLSSEMGNKAVSITDWILAAGHMGSGNPLTAVASVGAKRFFERFGGQTKAVAYNKLAKLAESGIPISAPPKFGGAGLLSRAALLGNAFQQKGDNQ